MKIRCMEPVAGMHKKYQPQLGKIYDAVPGKSNKKTREFVIVNITGKPIVLRKGEFEIVNA